MRIKRSHLRAPAQVVAAALEPLTDPLFGKARAGPGGNGTVVSCPLGTAKFDANADDKQASASTSTP